MSLGKTFASNESAKPLAINLIKVNLLDKKKKKLKIAPKKQTLLLKRIQKLEKENKPSEESAAAALNLSPRPTAEVSLSMKIKKNLALPAKAILKNLESLPLTTSVANQCNVTSVRLPI